MPRWKAPEILRNEAYLDVRCNDEGGGKRSRWAFFSSLLDFGLMMAEIKKKKETPKIDIFRAWCKACGICVAFCPTGTLAKDEAGNPYVKDIDKCINCGWCEIRCPDFAITVETKTKGKKRIEGKGGEEEPKPKEEDVSPERIVAPGQ